MAAKEEKARRRTATEVLIECVETFGVSEGEDILVIYTNVDRDVVVASNCTKVTAVGLAEMAKSILLKGK